LLGTSHQLAEFAHQKNNFPFELIAIDNEKNGDAVGLAKRNVVNITPQDADVMLQEQIAYMGSMTYIDQGKNKFDYMTEKARALSMSPSRFYGDAVRKLRLG